MESAWKQFEDWVTRQGGRHTPERRLLFEAVYALPQIFSPADVTRYLSTQMQAAKHSLVLSRPTVYNTLEAFVHSGILSRVHVHGKNMYVRTGGQQVIILQECVVCGAVQHIKPGGVPMAIKHLAFRHFTPMNSATVVHGVCSKCDSNRNNNKTP